MVKRAQTVSVAAVVFLGGLACGLRYARWRWSGVESRPNDPPRRGTGDSDDVKRAWVRKLMRAKWRPAGMEMAYRGLTDEALAAFKALGDDAVEPLIEIMRERGGWRSRLSVREAFGAIGPKAAPALIRASKDPDPYVRREAIRALVGLKPASSRVEAAIVSALKDNAPDVRRWALWALLRLSPKSPANEQALNAALKHVDASVRSCAIILLIRSEGRSPATSAKLAAALTDDDAGVRETAARAFGDLICNDDAAAIGGPKHEEESGMVSRHSRDGVPVRGGHLARGPVPARTARAPRGPE